MLADADLSAQHHAILDYNTSRESSLRGDYHVFTDLAVVPHMDQVVDLRSAADPRFIERSAINGCIGSNLDIVFDY